MTCKKELRVGTVKGGDNKTLTHMKPCRQAWHENTD
jgi:hypothetical protein